MALWKSKTPLEYAISTTRSKRNILYNDKPYGRENHKGKCWTVKENKETQLFTDACKICRNTWVETGGSESVLLPNTCHSVIRP